MTREYDQVVTLSSNDIAEIRAVRDELQKTNEPLEVIARGIVNLGEMVNEIRKRD